MALAKGCCATKFGPVWSSITRIVHAAQPTRVSMATALRKCGLARRAESTTAVSATSIDCTAVVSDAARVVTDVSGTLACPVASEQRRAIKIPANKGKVAVRFIHRRYDASRFVGVNFGTAAANAWGCSTEPAGWGHGRQHPLPKPSGFSSKRIHRTTYPARSTPSGLLNLDLED